MSIKTYKKYVGPDEGTNLLPLSLGPNAPEFGLASLVILSIKKAAEWFVMNEIFCPKKGFYCKINHVYC